LRIDAHHSANERYTLAYLESILKRNRFERSILVGMPQPTPDYVAGIIARLENATGCPKLCGVQIGKAEQVPDAIATGLPIDVLHLLGAVPEIARQCHQTPIVIDHLGYPASATWSSEIEAAASLPNVYCKLSGLFAFGDPRPYVRTALAVFGRERLMFGSDWPNGLPERTWKAALALFTQSIGAQTIEVREELLGGTASRVYGI
jgi:L-fuconolactonase